MHPPGPVKLVPLAPPKAAKSTQNRPSSSQDSDNRFNWSAWLSPKFARPNRLDRRRTGRDDYSPAERRPRRASFDDDPLSPSGRDDSMLIGQCNSADKAFDAHRKDTDSPTQQKSNTQSSLLTAFLLSLDELLPQYCDHLMTASDMAPSNGAAAAIEVLERGSKQLCQDNSIKRESPKFHNLAHGLTRKSETPQSRSPTFSFLKQLSTGSPVKEMRESQAYEHLHHLLSPSPIRQRQFSKGDKNTPRSVPSSPSYLDKGMSKTTANEWERFVSPFLMLAAAEVFYGRMEHVIDPSSEHAYHAKNRPEYKSKSGDGDIVSSHMPAFRFPFLDCLHNIMEEKDGPISTDTNIVRKSPLVSFDFAPRNESPTRRSRSQSTCESPSAASKRGSKRLIAIYKQVRDDFVIVGEYLCDPVLGNKQQRDLMPALPYQEDESVTRLKPKLSKHADDDKETDERRLAALSLRDTLSNLMSFIDARCALINIHAEICHRTLSSDLLGGSWVALAKKCETVQMNSRLMDRCIKEANALQLVLEIVDYIESFDFFGCSVCMRRLYVLLGKSPQSGDRDSLPMMWIRTIFARLLSLVKVIFSETALSDPMMPKAQPRLSRTFSSNKKLHKRDESTNAPSMFSFDVLSSDLVASSGSDLHLAVIVVRRSEDNSWMPVHIKNSIHKRPEQPTESTWPFTLWNLIEKDLDDHFKSTAIRSFYEIDSNSNDLEASVKSRMASLADNSQGIPLIGKKYTADTKSSCHVATISDKICLLVIRGSEGTRKRKVSDEDISKFIDAAAPQLLAMNVFSVEVVLNAKSLMRPCDKSDSRPLRGMYNKNHLLWDGLEWDGDKQKQMKVLSSLGLRDSNRKSPIIAPLKSPYVKDLRRRRKKAKSSINHGHLQLFLGDLSQSM